jgi:hypothetical protein
MEALVGLLVCHLMVVLVQQALEEQEETALSEAQEVLHMQEVLLDRVLE